MVEGEVVPAKIAVIDRCIQRIQHVRGAPDGMTPVDIEDITVLNLTRAAQAAIDLATHVVSTEAYGLPGDVAESFALLGQHGGIDADLAAGLRKMAGFRNIAVHGYQTIDPRIVDHIVTHRLRDLQALATAVRLDSACRQQSPGAQDPLGPSAGPPGPR